MKNAPDHDRKQIFRRAFFIVLILGILSIGTSNVISALVAPSTGILEPVSLILIPVYFASAFFIRRESMTAYLIAIIAFTLSSASGLITSFVNAERAGVLVGNSVFGGITILNILFIVIVWTALFRGYNTLRKMS